MPLNLILCPDHDLDTSNTVVLQCTEVGQVFLAIDEIRIWKLIKCSIGWLAYSFEVIGIHRESYANIWIC